MTIFGRRREPVQLDPPADREPVIAAMDHLIAEAHAAGNAVLVDQVLDERLTIRPSLYDLHPGRPS